MSDFLQGDEAIFEDFIFEMATISPEDHKLGVPLKMNILQPGDKKLSHGPRVKFFKKGMSTSGFSISLSGDPNQIKLVAGNIKGLVTESELNELIKNIQKYRVPLLNMWHDPEMSQRELIKQMRGID